MPSIRSKVVERADAPRGKVLGAPALDWDRPFDVRVSYEQGFAEIYARDVAPKLAPIAVLWRQQRGSRLRRLIGWLVVIGGAWLVLWLGVRPLDGIPLMVAGGLTLLAAGIALGHILARRRWEGAALRELLIKAACEHMPGLAYQRAAVRRINYDQYAELGLVPRFEAGVVEDLFEGRHRDIDFRLIEADLRIAGGRSVFHGLLLEFDVTQSFSGRVTIRQERDDMGRRLDGVRRLAPPPGQKIAFAADPQFSRRFDVHADDETAARTLVTASMRIAILRLAERLGPAPCQTGFAYGRFLVALPDRARFFEPSPPDAPAFDPVGDAHRLLAELRIPYRVVDTLYGIDPETGERFRPL